LKRLIMYLVLGVGLVSGCSDSQTFQTTAGIAGSYDVALVGRYLFVTSSDRNELRVLDLEASPRDWIRAPNPIEPLSIPVLERPSQLTRDVRYAPAEVTRTVAEGQTVSAVHLEEVAGGPYLYARSAGSQQISIVSADPASFKEIRRLRELGFVTAFAARGPMGGKSSILYYATQDSTGARLHRLELRPEELASADPLKGIPIAGLDLAGETVTALLVLPPTLEQQEQEHLVVATRRITGATTGGRTFRLDAVSGAIVVPDYQFGAPVRLLATHPLVADPNEEGGRCDFDPTDPRPEPSDPTAPFPGLIEAGTYVFGVLDESFCGGQLECSGVLAVEAATGLRPRDSTNVPMLPIKVGDALPTGLTLVADARVPIRCRKASAEEDAPLVRASQARPLLGIIPASDGQITLFDAVRLRPFDFDLQGARVFALLMTDSAGREIPITSRLKLADAIQVDLVEGVTQNDTFRLVYEGSLPNLGSRPLSGTPVDCTSMPGSCTFKVDSKAVRQRDGTLSVQPGDVIALEGEGGTCQDLVVSEVKATGEISTTTAISPECAEVPRFSVRAAPGTFAAYSDREGYQGRAWDDNAGEPFTAPGAYFFHPKDFNPEQAPFRARITLQLSVADVQPRPTRGNQYVIAVQSGFVPFVFRPDTSSLLAGLGAYRLPGPVVHTQVGNTDLAYIAYPSADGILQVNLGSIVDNEANSRGLLPFQ
jgi:hypothetical protein